MDLDLNLLLMLFLSNLIYIYISVENKNEKGEIVKIGRKDRLTFLEYAERMHTLSMRRREKLTNKKKIYCEEVKNKWKSEMGHH
jgi:hypothetical protein